MSRHNTFGDLTKDFSPERRARVDAKKKALRAAMPLHELRKARALTQKAIGDALNVNQPAIAKLEQRTDMYVSRLRAYIEAMGGKLNIVARFPEGDVAIANLADIDDEPDTVTPAARIGEPMNAPSRTPTEEQRTEIETLADLPDNNIDTTDIPEILDWSGAKRRL